MDGILFSKLASTLFYTVKIAFMSMVIAVLIGVPAAWVTSRYKNIFSRFLSSFSAVPLCIPPLLIALGYVLVFGMNGTVNRFLMKAFNLSSPPLTFLYSFWGIVIAEGFYNFPLVMRFVSLVWEKIPSDESDAALLLGANKFRVFRTITLYQLSSSISSSAMLVFLYCFFSFIIVMLFGSIGGTTLEVELFQAARVTMNYSYAKVLIIVEIIFAMLIVILYSFLEKKGSNSSGIFITKKRKQMSYKTLLSLIPFLVLILLFFFYPLISIVFSSGSWKDLLQKKSFLMALKNTLITGTLTGFLSTVIGFAFSCLVRTFDPLKKKMIYRIIPIIPNTISSVALGVIVIMLLHSLHLKGNFFLLVIVQVFTAWPFSFRQIISSFDRIPLELDLQEKLLSNRRKSIIFNLYMPLTKKSLLCSFGFTFAISAGDASFPLILGIPNCETLALYTYRLVGSYRLKEACSCAILLILLTVCVFFFQKEE